MYNKAFNNYRDHIKSSKQQWWLVLKIWGGHRQTEKYWKKKKTSIAASLCLSNAATVTPPAAFNRHPARPLIVRGPLTHLGGESGRGWRWRAVERAAAQVAAPVSSMLPRLLFPPARHPIRSAVLSANQVTSIRPTVPDWWRGGLVLEKRIFICFSSTPGWAPNTMRSASSPPHFEVY